MDLALEPEEVHARASNETAVATRDIPVHILQARSLRLDHRTHASQAPFGACAGGAGTSPAKGEQIRAPAVTMGT